MEFRIRKIEQKDNADIEKIIRDCLIEYGGNHAGTAWADPDLGRFSFVYAADGSAYWVAEDEAGTVVGGVGIGPVEGVPGMCELQKMYCVPAVRGNGVAHKLLETALEFARSRYASCYLETLDNMVEAQRFYEKHGFARTEMQFGETGHFACQRKYLMRFEKEDKESDQMKLSPLFSDGAVFQRGREIRVFGSGNGIFRAGFLGETRSVKANGSFSVTFSAHEAGGPYEMEVFLNGEARVIGNIMIGEVILVGGQSNAELTIGETNDKDTVFPSDDSIRYFVSRRPDSDGEGRIVPLESPFHDVWTPLRSEEASGWSAIALHAARHYAKKEKVAVGVIGCFKGATTLQAFMSEESLKEFTLDPSRFHIDATLFPWNPPGYIYKTMVKPLVPFAVGAVVWYQGESNRSMYDYLFYEKMLVMLVRDWRSYFGTPEMPFAIVQVNRLTGDEGGEELIREAQKRAAAVIPHCRLVRVDDLGEHDRIHPMKKRELSERICAALDEIIAENRSNSSL